MSVRVLKLKEGMQTYHADIFCLEYDCFVNVPMFGQYFCVSDSTKRAKLLEFELGLYFLVSGTDSIKRVKLFEFGQYFNVSDSTKTVKELSC